MKIRLLFVLLCSILIINSAFAQRAERYVMITEREANKWADALVEALVDNFWGASFKGYERRYFFNKKSQMADMSTTDYWPQAHAIDVITDAYQRTGKKKYARMYAKWWDGMPRFNPDARNGRRKGDLWWNAYVDDMEWHCLALIRIYEATKDTQYLNKARQMYADWIWSQWSPADEAPWYGGITWKTDIAPSKNACSNGPAAIVAARLAQFAEVDSRNDRKTREEYLDEAKKIYQWERKYLWNAETGAIYDNMDKDGKIATFSLSYNQGTFIGAAVELFRLTGNHQYIEDAVLTARFTTGRLSRRNRGVLSDATEGDGGLFHGIFYRYFANLIVLPQLERRLRDEFTDYLKHSATVMTTRGINSKTNLYGGRWYEPQPAEEPSALTPQLSACMLLEALCKVLDARK